MGNWVVMGRVSGLYGVRGWVKVLAHTEARGGIVGYNPLYLNIQGEWQRATIEQGRLHGKGLIVKFAGCDDRVAAQALIGCDIAVRREQLPAPQPGEYYWVDLEGLRVVTVDGVEIGVVERLFETGANEVVVVRGERERLIPFLRGAVITDIDLEQGVMRVDWDPTF